jgi:hypothetical protein
MRTVKCVLGYYLIVKAFCPLNQAFVTTYNDIMIIRLIWTTGEHGVSGVLPVNKREAEFIATYGVSG